MPARILIAEDDPLSLSLLQRMLEGTKEFEVVTALDGNEAWARLEAGPAFDLCIFDVMMPGLDGLELTGRLRRDPRFQNQRVMFCTALNDRATVDEAAALAASHYIVKPYFREHVLKQVRRICAQSRSQVSLESPRQAAARLGLEPAQVATFQQDLQLAVERLLTDLRRGTKAGIKPGLRANSLKGAALNLGAHALAEQLGVLEIQLADLTAPRLAQTLTAVEIEAARLRNVGAAA
jgi:CheY-like chemotaxis protein